MPCPPYRGRFAPSPTGPLHFGSLLAAFGSWLLARHAGGEWLVRVEDIDPPRTVPGAIDAQLHTLASFGLHSDLEIVRQSERDDLYRQALTQLLDAGVAFHCGCSRSELATAHGIHHACLSSDRPRNAVRLRVPPDSVVEFDDGLQGNQRQDVHAEVGDFVLLRADGYWAYQLAVVVDDAAQQISHVVRGADLLDSTPRQILLQRALGVATPHYLHLPLALDAHGRKLSKSESALPVDNEQPLPTLHAVWHALGQDEAVFAGVVSLRQLLHLAVQHFEPTRLPRHWLPPATGHMEMVKA